MKAALLAGTALATLALGGWYLVATTKPPLPPGAPEPTTFIECAKYYPVTGKPPRQCTNGAGIISTEDLGNTLEFASTIKISSPAPNDAISSPVYIRGDAAAEWFEEGTDISIAVVGPKGEALGEERLSPKTLVSGGSSKFEGSVIFAKPRFGTTGSILIQKPSSRDTLRIPVSFK